MLELATSCWVICRSFLMVTVNYRIRLAANCNFGTGIIQLTSGGKAYHDRNATMKPKQAKKKTRPYRSIGLKMGMVKAFRLAGLISGEAKRTLREAIAGWRSDIDPL